MYFTHANFATALILSASVFIVAACNDTGAATSTASTQNSGPTQTTVTMPGSSGIAPVGATMATPEILSADTNRANNSTFVLGESVELSFKASGLPASKATTVAVNVIDEFGNEVSSSSLLMTADAAGNASAVFAAPASKYGYYKVEATLPNGTTLARLGTRPAGFITYAVVPDPANRINYGDAGSRFGMQGGFSSAQGNVLQYLGIRYLLDGPGWSVLEPDHADQFAEARSAALAKGQIYPAPIAGNSAAWPTYPMPLLTRASVPAWAMEPGTSGKNCTSMGALNSGGVEGFPAFAKALASEVAADYVSRSAHYYQVTWEPASWCFEGTPQQVVQFYQLSYGPIHRADPKAIVMGPTLFPEDKMQMSELWSAGLANYLDAVSMHPYVKWPPETNGLVSNIRMQMQMARDAKGHSIPFVGTEHGYTSSSIGELNEALGDIRATIILLGEGFKFDFAFYIADFWDHNPSETKNTYGYYWNLDPKIRFGTDKLGPKPAAPAFAAMTYWLDGTTTSGPLSNLSGTQMGYRFQRNGTTILTLWDYKAASSSMSLAVPAESIQICNWMGNCNTIINSSDSINFNLSASPTYVIGHGL
jgi:hypothetical protein